MINKNKKKCIIILGNKKYPLEIEFIIKNNNIRKLKINLIYFEELLYIDIINNKYLENIYKYTKLIKDSNINLPKIRYAINKNENKIYIFGEEFVEKNKDNFFIQYKDKIFPLKEYFNIKDIDEGDDKLEISLIKVNKIINMKKMFFNCYSLEEFIFPNENKFKENKIKEEENSIISENSKTNDDIYSYTGNDDKSIYRIINNYDNSSNIIEEFKDITSITNKSDKTDWNNYIDIKFKKKLRNPLINSADISKWDTSNVKDMSYIFFRCLSLKSLPNISEWNTGNVENMGYMFCECLSLKSLPDISYWNTSNVKNMGSMFGLENPVLLVNQPKISDDSQKFNNSSSLMSLPDISKWNTKNVINMENMFYSCSKLSDLPDISKWNTDNLMDMSKLFYDCSSLISLPDISKWNTENVINMSDLFNNCSSLKFLPDISKWNTENVKNMNDLFNNCSSLMSLPDISKWAIDGVKSIISMFSKCSSLSILPDISKWNTENIIDMHKLFYGCYSLSSLPDISKWIIKNCEDISDMFDGCYSLSYLPNISKWNFEQLNEGIKEYKDCFSLINEINISPVESKQDNQQIRRNVFHNYFENEQNEGIERRENILPFGNDYLFNPHFLKMLINILNNK